MKPQITKTTRHQFTIRMNAEQWAIVQKRVKWWQEKGEGSRSRNDWCLMMLLRAELPDERDSNSYDYARNHRSPAEG